MADRQNQAGACHRVVLASEEGVQGGRGVSGWGQRGCQGVGGGLADGRFAVLQQEAQQIRVRRHGLAGRLDRPGLQVAARVDEDGAGEFARAQETGT
ncbi:hypothetical protein ACFU7Y_30620 [Kitasatospora sp. NPDC057542]|uniref:hypothetical protein n=1 Tax=Kitasatospora sp. NPDC057542 TaxID=3346162 RepID=UPI0036B0B30E